MVKYIPVKHEVSHTLILPSMVSVLWPSQQQKRFDNPFKIPTVPISKVPISNKNNVYKK